MSMPSIPEFKHRPNQKETIIDLLESIALEEIALAHLINSEAEKNQAFVEKITCHKMTISDCEIEKYSEAIRKMVDTAIMKEWILLKKLETVLEIDFDCHKKHREDCCDERHIHCHKKNEEDFCDEHDCSHEHHKHHDKCVLECRCGHCICELHCECKHHKCKKHPADCD